MSRIEQKPSLSLGNRIYLYRLLREAIGCGKQTLLPAVEEALEAERLGAIDLGFENTRELMEALDDCVQLTVFKGGRIYATVIAQPAWDEALAATPAASKGNKPTKSFKKKRADKTLKAVRPKRVKRPEPKPEPEPKSEPKPEPAAEEMPANPVDAEPTEPKTVERGAAAVSATEPKDQPEAVDPEPQTGDETHEEAATPEERPAEPAISLTVVYDPEHANDGVKTLASTPAGDVKAEETEPEAQPQPEPSPKPEIEPEKSIDLPAADKTKDAEPAVTAENEGIAPVPEAQPEPAPAAPVIPDGYPTDFPAEVFCPGDILAQLAALLPYGADAMGIAGEYYWIARENGSINAARNRATFPLRYTYEGQRHEATIRLRRNASGSGAAWAIDQVTPVE